MAELSSLSTQYVEVQVTVTDPVSGNVLNPTADTVQMAFTATNVDPQTADWVTAAWRSGGPPYMAQALVGPANGGKVLAKGSYRVWIKVTDNPEVPAIRSGFLKIT